MSDFIYLNGSKDNSTPQNNVSGISKLWFFEVIIYSANQSNEIQSGTVA